MADNNPSKNDPKPGKAPEEDKDNLDPNKQPSNISMASERAILDTLQQMGNRFDRRFADQEKAMEQFKSVLPGGKDRPPSDSSKPQSDDPGQRLERV